jgi:anaerobic magnesium-protoporphyrin IX monomethyl ester cyclase
MRDDLLLTHGYFLGEDAHERKVMKPYPTLGLLYLSAYLKRAGFGVRVFDTTFAEREALYRDLDAPSAPVLGIYTNLITRPAVLAIIRRAKASGWTVVLGGPESAGYPEAYLGAGADVIVFGEGEAALVELLPALAREGPHRLHGVAGIAFRDEFGAIARTPPRPNLRDLDALPWPDREAIDIGAYLSCWRQHHGAGSVNLITARGCPYTCRWCSHGVFGFGHARRSPEDVAAEVAWIHERYAPEQLWYADDVFSINYRWLGTFAEAMRRRALAIPFECITRADRVTDEVAAQMRALGCYRVWLGSESGSQRVLDAMARGVTVTEVQAATHRLRAAGIQVGMFLMWGYEGEGPEDIEATIEHVKRSNPDVFFTTVAYPIKGTPYFDETLDRIVPTLTWEAGSDRDLAIRGRRSKRYFSFATRRLKHEVALHRLRQSGISPRTAAPILRESIGVVHGRLGMRWTESEVEA